jgi:ribosome-associated translation inhibitor RaiA
MTSRGHVGGHGTELARRSVFQNERLRFDLERPAPGQHGVRPRVRLQNVAQIMRVMLMTSVTGGLMEPVDFVIRAGRPDTIDALREYTVRRLSFALRRFERQIHRLTVRISDLNGPRRGVDARCSMTVDLNNGRRIFVDATTAWPFASVTQAASRLSEALRRELGRTTMRRMTRWPRGNPGPA